MTSETSESLFSPVKVTSPLPPTGINLTGLPRRVKDSCAELYNNCRRWEKVKIQGAGVIRRIAIVKVDREGDEVKLGELCDELLRIYEELVEVAKVFGNVRRNFEALVRIEEIKSPSKSGNCAREIPFLSYDLAKYVEMICIVEDSYLKELKCKKTILEKVPHQNKESMFRFVNLCWSHDPYVTEDVTRTVLALVAECGFK